MPLVSTNSGIVESPHQTALVKWMPFSNAQNPVFSVYRTETAIELHLGCEERGKARLISTHHSYEDAYEFCELLAEQIGLPVCDYTLE